MVLTNPGPVLAEEEMLHDGEPVFALAWGGAQVAEGIETGHRRQPESFPSAVEKSGGSVDRAGAAPAGPAAVLPAELVVGDDQ